MGGMRVRPRRPYALYRGGCRGLIAVAAALIIVADGPVTAVQMARTSTLTLTFYDKTGAAMTGQAAYDLIRAKADNLANGYAGKVVMAAVDPASLADVNPVNAPISPTVTAAGLTVAVPAGAALSVTWPTSATRGYSELELDNAGAGYRSSATVNFTYRAALDVKRRFDLAVTARTGATPAYVPSPAFSTARAALDDDYTAMTAVGTESARGRLGWRVLDDVHTAYDLILAEYGPRLARYKGAHGQGRPWLGTTFDDAQAAGTATRLEYARDATLPAGAATNPGYGWVRIAFDLGSAPADYDGAVLAAHRDGLRVMGMPFDSTTARACHPRDRPTGCTAAQYTARYASYLRHFSNRPDPRRDVDAWEVGNEVNGEWIDTDPRTDAYSYGSGGMATKISQVADLVHATTRAPTVGTLYWQTATSDYPKNSTFRWARDNLVATGIARKLDVVLLSTYVEDAPMGIEFDHAMSALRAMFPRSEVGVGEFDYFYTDTARYFWSLSHLTARSTQAAAQAARPALAAQYYAAALGYPRSVGGMFWWYYQEESAGTAGADLRDAIKGVATKVYRG